MKNLFQLGFVIVSPILALIYWHNSMKELDKLEGQYNLQFSD